MLFKSKIKKKHSKIPQKAEEDYETGDKIENLDESKENNSAISTEGAI